MGELIRRSSLDRLYSSINSSDLDTRGNAIAIIQEWWKRRYRLIKLMGTLRTMHENIEIILGQISNIKSQSFESVQNILTSCQMSSALSTIVTTLPTDPILQKNNNMTRSVRFLCSCIMIYAHPDKILSYSKDYSMNEVHEDQSDEAKHCRNAATMCYHAFIRLLKSSINNSYSTFRIALVSYRSSVRYFLYSLRTWEQIDSDRLITSLEIPFQEIYMLLLSIEQAHKKGDLLESDFLTSKQKIVSEFARIQNNLLQLLGQKGHERIYELKAYCESMLSASDDNNAVDILSQSPSTTTATTIPVTLPSSSFAAASTAAAAGGIEQPISTNNVLDDDNIDMSPSLVELTTSLETVISNNLHVEFSEPENQLVHSLATVTEIPLDVIIYSLCVNGKYAFTLEWPCPEFVPYQYHNMLTSSPLSSSSLHDENNEQQPDNMRQVLRNMILRVIGDKLISSLQPSTIENATDVKFGDIITLRLQSNANEYLTAQIIAKHEEEATIDVRYLCDEKTELNVEMTRIILKSTPANPIPFLSALQDLIERILSLVPRQRATISAAFAQAVDLQLIKQMIENNAFGVHEIEDIIVYILDKLIELQAPVNVQKTERWRDSFSTWTRSNIEYSRFLLVLPSFFEFCSSCIEEIKVDMSNFYLQSLANIFIRKGPQYLTTYFCNSLQLGLVNLHRTIHWLYNIDLHYVLAEVREAGISIDIVSLQDGRIHGSPIVISYLIAVGLCTQLQSNHRLDSMQGLVKIPETLLRDATKLSTIRDEIDIVALIATVLIVIRQTVIRFKIQLKVEEEQTIQIQLNKLVRRKDIVLNDIIIEGIRIVRACMETRHIDLKTFTTMKWEDDMRKALSNTVSQENIVRNLFSKRILKLLLRGLLSQPIQEKLQMFSLSSTLQSKSIAAIIASTRRLFQLNLSIFFELYKTVFAYSPSSVVTDS